MRIIVIHSREPIISQTDAVAHCFGPYENYEAALLADTLAPDDCWKWALDLVGPLEEDVNNQWEHSPNHERWHGSGPKVQ